MKKKLLALFMALILLAGVVPAFETGAEAETAGIPAAEAAGEGRLFLSGIGTNIAYRLVLPDGTATCWSARSEEDDDFVMIQPLDGGEYKVETCSLSALPVLDPEEEQPKYKYDLRSDIPESQIQTSAAITVAQPADEGDNIVDLAQGDVLFSSSYNEYAVFAKENNFNDSDFDYSVITHAPALKYVSTDDGSTWKKITGDVTLMSSAAEPVASEVLCELYYGNGTTVLTLDNLKTAGYIHTATFGETVMKIKGDVSIKGVDTEYFGKLTVLGADSSAKLTVSKSIVSCFIEIKDLAELKMECPNIAINSIMGDTKLTNIRKMDIAVTSEYASGIRSYDENVIFTDVFGTIGLTNNPAGKVIETGEGKQFIINSNGSYVYTGADHTQLHLVEWQAEGADDAQITGVFPMDQLGAHLSISSAPAAAEDGN